MCVFNLASDSFAVLLILKHFYSVLNIFSKSSKVLVCFFSQGSLISKLPEDQMENGTFLEFVQHLILIKWSIETRSEQVLDNQKFLSYMYILLEYVPVYSGNFQFLITVCDFSWKFRNLFLSCKNLFNLYIY